MNSKIFESFKAYRVSPYLWKKIFDSYPDPNYWINLSEEEFGDYVSPYKAKKKKIDKNFIIYNGNNLMVIKECKFFSLIDEPYETSWKQIVLRMDESTKTYEEDLTGLSAYMNMANRIKKFYTDEEYEECLNSHEAEYNEDLKQYHYMVSLYDENKISNFDNCYEYDINSAHGDALMEIFPKAADMIRKMYKERKKKPNNKKYMNYYVGFLTRVEHTKTYNWIVQRTTKKLLSAISETDGDLIYANTDGFVIRNPKHELNCSKEIGDFKLEYKGNVYVYYANNYSMIQTDKLKGSLMVAARDGMDLSLGRVISYTKQFFANTFIPVNITVIEKEIVNEA